MSVDVTGLGWFVNTRISAEELEFKSPALFQIWHFLLRYLVPPAVLIIFFFGVTE